MSAITRRDFLVRTGAAVGALTLARPALKTVSGRTIANKPNVILIVSDDQGTVDMGCYGASDLRTPNMDALASRGIRFTQFYVASSLCSPSRAAYLTGRYPQRAGLDHNARGADGLPPSEVTMAEMFKQAGYRTALFGKWHLGETLEVSPNAQGFDEFFGFKVGCIDNYSHFTYWRGPNRHNLFRNEQETYAFGQFFPTLVVQEASRFLEENRERPFFLYLPFNLPHYPLQPDPDHLRMFDHIQDEKRRRYAAWLAILDEHLGQVLRKVDELGLTERTIIVYFSDHGHSEEERAFFGGGSAGPYRGHKATLWEGGIRVPCIVSWPGRIPMGEVRDQIVTSMDWVPTLAELCDVSPPKRRLDGKSIVEMLRNPEARSPHDVLHWMLGRRWAVRRGQWKLVYDEELFLANLREDPGEKNNYATKHPGLVEELRRLHEKWLEDVRTNRD